MKYFFPFGSRVEKLVQVDQTPKEVFVLGVYASAVHAKWIYNDKIFCQALAVASEPRIFWDGNIDEAQTIIDEIAVPDGVGKLVLPNKNLNGPSGKVLIENILNPLGLSRNDAWLCDLLPESRMNPKQQKVIKERYNPLIEKYHLNHVTVPIDNGLFCDESRRQEITKEIIDSQAKYLILLGDMPIQQYMKYIDCGFPFSDLRSYTVQYGYGIPYDVNIGPLTIKAVPLTHPRQIGGLGASSMFWHDQHKSWEDSRHRF